MMTAFGSIIVVIAVVIWAGFNGLDSVVDTYENEVLRIAETMMLSERAEKHFHALATAFSGYLVTRNPSYISDFRTASQEGAATIAQIRQLAQSEEAQRDHRSSRTVQQEYTQQVESLFAIVRGRRQPVVPRDLQCLDDHHEHGGALSHGDVSGGARSPRLSGSPHGRSEERRRSSEEPRFIAHDDRRGYRRR